MAVVAAGLITTALVAGPLNRAGALIANRPIVGMASTPDGHGYWMVASDGGVFTFGDANFYGSAGNIPLNRPVVGMAATPDGHGYWLVASDGGIFTYGDAGFHGSAGAIPLNRPIVGMARTPDGHGYWLVASDGGIFTYGDAGFYGSAGAIPLNRPVVGMAATPDGHGYWLVASDGGIFTYGDAGFHGSAGAIPLNRPVVGMAPTPNGLGYWLVASDGGIFTYGDAGFHGSTGSITLSRPVVGMAPTPSGLGYWLVASDGGIFTYGDAGFYGSVPALPPPGPPRLALYGDSLASEAAPFFSYMAQAAGGSTRVNTYGGVAICDYLPTMASDASSWQPTAAVLSFTGNAFTACMAGYTPGTPQFFAKYQQDAQAAISIFHTVGTPVYLIGAPLNSTAAASQNIVQLNQIYASLAASNYGVTYVDAGQAVMASGAFTMTLPCLSFEPCTGPSGTNIVRSPDGVHFCPTGNTSQIGVYAVCDVYSSGAFRFAMAMLGPALSG
jgi:hypothetical protein